MEAEAVQELGYAQHEQRQRSQCTLEGLEAGMARLAIGGRARWRDGSWEPLPYPGFALQAMADADARNAATAERLIGIRDELVGCASAPGRYYPLPQASLHQTVANLLSDARLEQHILRRGLSETFPRLLAEQLSAAGRQAGTDTVQMSLIGVAAFRTAFGALGVFADPQHYARVLALRERVYANPQLCSIGIARTRPFIGHVTLGYFEAQPTPAERRVLIARMAALNEALAKEPLAYFMPVARLCSYRDLSAFTPHPVDLALAI